MHSSDSSEKQQEQATMTDNKDNTQQEQTMLLPLCVFVFPICVFALLCILPQPTNGHRQQVLASNRRPATIIRKRYLQVGARRPSPANAVSRWVSSGRRQQASCSIFPRKPHVFRITLVVFFSSPMTSPEQCLHQRGSYLCLHSWGSCFLLVGNRPCSPGLPVAGGTLWWDPLVGTYGLALFPGFAGGW